MFANLDKAAVVQEARCFNDSPLNPKKCCALLSKVLFMIYNGEVFGATEATKLFFCVTKAFQSKEVIFFSLSCSLTCEEWFIW